MKKLFKLLIWSTIITGIFTSVIYYRYFLFSAEFNQPVDVVISDVSKKINIKIPSYQISVDVVSADHAVSEENTLQQKEVVNEVDMQGAEQKTVEFQVYEALNSELIDSEVQGSDIPDSDISDSSVSDSGALNSETTDSQLSVTDIVSAVKDTVNEALDIFKEEREQLAVEGASASTASELLFRARLAYWNRDLKSAENAYIKLTEMVDDPNAYGELGNLYYMQSRWKKAGDAYYHAALKLKEIKQIDQAWHLLRIIRGLDSDTANKLQIELQHSS